MPWLLISSGKTPQRLHPAEGPGDLPDISEIVRDNKLPPDARAEDISEKIAWLKELQDGRIPAGMTPIRRDYYAAQTEADKKSILDMAIAEIQRYVNQVLATSASKKE